MLHSSNINTSFVIFRTAERLHRNISPRDRGAGSDQIPRLVSVMLPVRVTRPLTLAVRAELQNEWQALELWVGRIFRLQLYLFIAAIAALSLIFLPCLLGRAKKTLLGRIY